MSKNYTDILRKNYSNMHTYILIETKKIKVEYFLMKKVQRWK